MINMQVVKVEAKPRIKASIKTPCPMRTSTYGPSFISIILTKKRLDLLCRCYDPKGEFISSLMTTQKGTTKMMQHVD